MKTLRGQNGHSVLEVISAISIIIILASLLFSAITFSRSKAKQSVCINNQYQLAKALIMYATDSEKLPTTLGEISNEVEKTDAGFKGGDFAYAAFTADYYQNVQEIKQCPEAKPLEGSFSPNSYGLNLYITNQNLSAITSPSETVLTADSNYKYLESSDQGAKRHFGGIVVSFVDGHVEWMRELPPLTLIVTEETPSNPDLPPPPPSPFDLNGGTLTLNEDSSTHVNILSVPYADQGQSNWFEVYVDILVTLPGGAEFIYNVIGNNAQGVTGAMNRNQLEGFSWDSTIFEEGSQIDIMGTSKYWTRTQQTVKGKTKWTWTPQTNTQYSTQNDYGTQVWVLRDGDVIPNVPGTWSQIQLDSQVTPYTEVGPDGLTRMNLSDNQVMYFFELGETSPYQADGQPNPNYNMNDLVILTDINEP